MDILDQIKDLKKKLYQCVTPPPKYQHQETKTLKFHEEFQYDITEQNKIAIEQSFFSTGNEEISTVGFEVI